MYAIRSYYGRFGSGFAQKRAAARTAYGIEAFEALRTAGAAIRDRGLEQLDSWLERFEAEATRNGTEVRWAESADEVRAQVLEICARYGLKKAIKSKSMLSEEAGLNAALEASGMEVVETDLGEYIIRITSYNVCYTKLLRIWVPAMRVNHFRGRVRFAMRARARANLAQ